MIVESLLNLIYNIIDTIIFFQLPEFPDGLDWIFEDDGLIECIGKLKRLLNYFIDLDYLLTSFSLVCSVLVVYYSYKLIMYIYLNFIKL